MKLIVIALLLLGSALAAPSVEVKLTELLRELLQEKEEPLMLAQQGVGEALMGRSLDKRSAAAIVQTITAYDKNGNKKQMTVKDMCLNAHNKVRALHTDTPPLEYDEGIASGAADWALHMASTGQFDHSSKEVRKFNGENIFYSAAGKSLGTAAEPVLASPAAAVFSWYEESWKVNHREQPYDYNLKTNPGTGHFTQVVWKGSSKLGCGVATISKPNPQNPSYPMQYTYITARYEKTGNLKGAFKDNVLPLKQGAQHPQNASSLVAYPGCLNYGANCRLYSNFCSMIGDKCGCTCS